jgi:hypothetical protein
LKKRSKKLLSAWGSSHAADRSADGQGAALEQAFVALFEGDSDGAAPERGPKRLFPNWPRRVPIAKPERLKRERKKFFCFFLFTKRRTLPSCLQPWLNANPRNRSRGRKW